MCCDVVNVQPRLNFSGDSDNKVILNLESVPQMFIWLLRTYDKPKQMWECGTGKWEKSKGRKNTKLRRTVEHKTKENSRTQN